MCIAKQLQKYEDMYTSFLCWCSLLITGPVTVTAIVTVDGNSVGNGCCVRDVQLLLENGSRKIFSSSSLFAWDWLLFRYAQTKTERLCAFKATHEYILYYCFENFAQRSFEAVRVKEENKDCNARSLRTVAIFCLCLNNAISQRYLICGDCYGYYWQFCLPKPLGSGQVIAGLALVK